MTIFYEIPQLPESLRPNTTESELSFIAPIARKNYVINPGFEIDNIGETQPYNWDVGTYNYATNVLSSITDVGSVVTENVYSGFQSMRCNFGNDTTTKMVYGRTQPIVLPLSAKEGAFYSSNQDKTLYRVKGALTFFVFAPAIDPYNQFSIFNQPTNSSRDLVVNVYATVDANGEPTADFSAQTVITSANVTVTVPDATFFSEEIEPNYIGRRKNPVWTRHVVYFNTVFDYQKDNFIRFSISSAAPLLGQNTNFVFYMDAVQVEFFDDDFPFYTTYIDGDLGSHDPLHPTGYYWEGAIKKSISVRSLEAYSGGILFNLQKDFLFTIVNIKGLGLPTPTNNVTPFEYVDGQQYVSTGINSRKINISGFVAGDTALEVNRATGILQYLLSKERSGISSLRRFYYRIPASSCNNPASEYVFFDAVVESIKPDAESNSPRFSMTIDLNNINIYYYTDNYVYSMQSALQSNYVTPTKYGIKMFHAQGGNAIAEINTKVNEFDVQVTQSFFGHNNYDLDVDGLVHCWLELDDGNIIFGGQFQNITYTINSVSTSVSCNNIAILNPSGVVYPIRDYDKRSDPSYNKLNGVGYITPNNGTSVDYGANAIVRSIIQTNIKTIMIGGCFSSVVGRSSECNNICHVVSINKIGEVVGVNIDVEGGLYSKINNSGVYTLLYVALLDSVFVGGQFERTINAVNSATGAYRSLRNAAIYRINRDYKWDEMFFGANNTVTTMTFFQNRYVVCGGLFTAWYTEKLYFNLLTQTRYAAVYDTAVSTANDKRIKTLSSVITPVPVTPASLPTLSAVFDQQVNVMVTEKSGSVIIGGRFTKIDMNSNATVALQNFTVNRIVRWNGYDRYSLMETGIATSSEVKTSLPLDYTYTEVLGICTCPYTDDVYIVGTFTNVGNLTQAMGIARWAKNRWESLDFELQAESIKSVFVSKMGYGFVSYKTANSKTITDKKGKNPKTIEWTLNNLAEPNLIVIENVGMETQPVIELTNPYKNQKECDLLSIYNVTTNSSMTFSMKVFLGETITIDFSEPNIRPRSNIRNRISNSLVGGGTFSNFFLAEGKNVIKVLGGQRNPSGSEFIRPLEVKIRYNARQISPYQLYESDTITRTEEYVGWTLNRSKMGLDTKVLNSLKTDAPAYNWLANKFKIGVTVWGSNSVVVD